MTNIAFDNDKYLQTQSAHIRDRIAQFGGKLYLEFGGKLYDDNHASRVLPGFQPDSKLRMLLQLKDHVEMVIAINADDIEKNKVIIAWCQRQNKKNEEKAVEFVSAVFCENTLLFFWFSSKLKGSF